MEIIQVRLMGGLGNQLYQYAAAKFIQLKYPSMRINLDISGYETYKVRNLELNKFLDNSTVVFENRKNGGIIRGLYHIYQKVYRIIYHRQSPQITLNLPKRICICSSTPFEVAKIQYKKNYYLYGYFQVADMCKEVKEELMHEISLHGEESDKFRMYYEQIDFENDIAVSIRCGEDYRKFGWPICTRDFYENGISYIKENRGIGKVFIFADNLNKVKEEKWFSRFDVVYVEDLDVCESFQLLRNYSNYVCSNSSFSWWGAFLSYAKQPTIIAPNKVFRNSPEADTRIIYNEMIILDYVSGELIREERND